MRQVRALEGQDLDRLVLRAHALGDPRPAASAWRRSAARCRRRSSGRAPRRAWSPSRARKAGCCLRLRDQAVGGLRDGLVEGKFGLGRRCRAAWRSRRRPSTSARQAARTRACRRASEGRGHHSHPFLSESGLAGREGSERGALKNVGALAGCGSSAPALGAGAWFAGGARFAPGRARGLGTSAHDGLACRRGLGAGSRAIGSTGGVGGMIAARRRDRVRRRSGERDCRHGRRWTAGHCRDGRRAGSGRRAPSLAAAPAWAPRARPRGAVASASARSPSGPDRCHPAVAGCGQAHQHDRRRQRGALATAMTAAARRRRSRRSRVRRRGAASLSVASRLRVARAAPAPGAISGAARA